MFIRTTIQPPLLWSRLSRILNICDFEPGSEHVLSVVTNLDKEEQRNDCWPRSPGRVHSVHTYCA